MNKSRMEAFSDGVVAILITIMALELKAPSGEHQLHHLGAVFMAYILSFAYLGIYWNSHHHLMHGCKAVSGGVLWANLHFLFWLSLIPFSTAWMGEAGFTGGPVRVYGAVLLGSSIAYFILVQSLTRLHGADSRVAQAIGTDFKGRASILAHVIALGVGLVFPRLACALYAAIALAWLVPDERLEMNMQANE